MEYLISGLIGQVIEGNLMAFLILIVVLWKDKNQCKRMEKCQEIMREIAEKAVKNEKIESGNTCITC